MSQHAAYVTRLFDKGYGFVQCADESLFFLRKTCEDALVVGSNVWVTLSMGKRGKMVESMRVNNEQPRVTFFGEVVSLGTKSGIIVVGGVRYKFLKKYDASLAVGTTCSCVVSKHKNGAYAFDLHKMFFVMKIHKCFVDTRYTEDTIHRVNEKLHKHFQIHVDSVHDADANFLYLTFSSRKDAQTLSHVFHSMSLVSMNTGDKPW